MAEGDHARLTRVPMQLFGAAAFRLALRYLYKGALPLRAEGAESSSTQGFTEGQAGDGEDCADGALRPDSGGVALLLELLRIADYLELTHLKQRCERQFVDWDVIQVENVVDLFQHASQCHCGQLRATCLQYIRLMFDVVKETSAYGELPKALRNEVQKLK